jgi:transcriptional regulator of acetoin/glycerol metabolism
MVNHERTDHVIGALARAGSVSMDLLDSFEPDLRLAAARDVCVLITAAPDLALKVARDIADRDRRKRSGMRVVDCDALDPLAARAALAESLLQPIQPAHACGTLLLREVHALTRQNQTLLADLLTTGSNGDAPRVIASSSTALFDRVRNGQFDDRLFYRLNMIYMAFNE